jgi:peptidoglycan/LPS O-acetylase OafA/YrhL
MARTGYLGALDGLRGVAILFVLFSHASLSGASIIPGFDAGGSGKIGVWLFFVLSAFLLTTQMYRQAAERRLTAMGLADYAIGRFFRIFPLYALVLVLYAARHILTWRMVVEHLELRLGLGHFWTIPVETTYYAVLPVLVGAACWACRQKPGLFVSLCAAVAILLTCFAPAALAYSNTIALWPYLPVFLCGSAASVWLHDRPCPFGPWSALVAAVAIGLTVPSIWARSGFAPLHVPVLAYGILWVVIVMASANNRHVGAMLSTPWLTFVGRISFPLYLLHLLVLGFVQGHVHGRATGIVFLVAAVVLAWVAHKLVERPVIAAGAALRAWLKAYRAIAPAPAHEAGRA